MTRSAKLANATAIIFWLLRLSFRVRFRTRFDAVNLEEASVEISSTGVQDGWRPSGARVALGDELFGVARAHCAAVARRAWPESVPAGRARHKVETKVAARHARLRARAGSAAVLGHLRGRADDSIGGAGHELHRGRELAGPGEWRTNRRSEPARNRRRGYPGYRTRVLSSARPLRRAARRRDPPLPRLPRLGGRRTGPRS